VRIPVLFDLARKAGEGLLLHPQVLDLAEVVLQGLEDRDEGKDLLPGEEGCEELHEIAQLLAGLAQLVELVGMALLIDSGALGECGEVELRAGLPAALRDR